MHGELKNYATSELKEELKRREEIEKRNKASKPGAILGCDFTELRGLCTSVIDEAADQGFYDEDLERYIFESAMQTFYGKDVFEWLNKVTQ